MAQTTSAEWIRPKTRERKETSKEDRWDLQACFSSLEDWKKELEKWGKPGQTTRWPEFALFRGRLQEGAGLMKKALETYFSIDRQLTKLRTYAHLKHDEDIAENEPKQAYATISAICADFRKESSWLEPEILSLNDELLASYLKDANLSPYHIYLKKLIRFKPHVLSAEKEELIAMAQKALQSSYLIFGALNNADMKFPHVENSQGESLELTHGQYLLYIRNGKDRKLRENAFKTYHRVYGGFENTFCELIQSQVQTHVFEMRSRKFSSSLEAALFPNEIETSVYKNLIQTVRKHLPCLHKYISARKKILGYDTLHPYDLYVPLVGEVNLTFSYEKAEEMVIQSVAPLGSEYQNALKRGLQQQRWVDKYENLRKRSGAYSSGCFDSFPYILLNFQGAFHDLMTLAHEAGHSMHSYFSRLRQDYVYSDYSIFVAEVASTFNEELMLHQLMTQNPSKEVKLYLINQEIEDIRTTFFRQVMFAEFELLLHELVEKDVPLTPKLLRDEYRRLNREYYGPDLVLDEEIEFEWARIPHFYYNFYVFQYATGISAAHALFEKVMKEGSAAQQKYLKFLSSGSSRPPLELLAETGVDMRSSKPIEATLHHFEELVEQFVKMASKKI